MVQKHHTQYKKYQVPTHIGYIRHAKSGKQLKVRLTETKGFWASTTGQLYNKSDGLPRGQKKTAIWILDLGTIERTGTLADFSNT